MNHGDTKSTAAAVPKMWIIVLAIVCIVSVLAEKTYEHHGHVKYEDWFAFFGIVAMVGLALMAGVGHLLRWPLQREDDYYDV